MPKYVLSPEYLTELKRFLHELIDPIQVDVITAHYRLCSDYLHNSLSGKNGEYNHFKSTSFIVRAKFGVRSHLFTRVFDDTKHKSKAIELGIMSFEAPPWKVLKDKQVGQTYEFLVEDGKKPQRGEIHFRTKSVKQKNWMRPEELAKKIPKQNQKPKKKKTNSYSFPIPDKHTGEKRFITKYRSQSR